MSSTVEQIKDRLGIVDVVGSYIKLEPAGKNHKARCPFHNEKTPSFFLSPERETYYCFGCGAKGDILSFVQEFEGVDFMGALKILAERAGVELEQKNFAEKNPNARLYDVVRAAQDFFIAQLGKHADAQAYVAKRGITPETVKNFAIGFAPDDWRQLFDHLGTKGFSVDEMLAAGLIKRKEGTDGGASSQPYDVFRNRIMFPVFDSSGRTVAFSGRLLGPESDHAPKYLNSPETPIFKKSETLYGFDRAKQTMRQHNFAILVEGQVDLVMLHQNGFANTLAVMGTAFTPMHAAKLKRFSNNLAIALDADKAGVASALRTARVALAHGMDVKIVALPDGKDPADIMNEDKEIWKTALRTATHIVDFVIAKLTALHTDQRKLNTEIQKHVFPFIASIPNAIDRSHFVGRAARAMNVDEALVEQELAKMPMDNGQGAMDKGTETGTGDVVKVSKHDQIVRALVGITVWLEGDSKPLTANPPTGEAGSSQQAADGKPITYNLEPSTLLSRLTTILGTDPKQLFEESELPVLAFEAEVAYSGSTHLDHYVDEMLDTLEEETLKTRFAGFMEQLATVERQGNDAHSLEILAECKKISARLDELKNKKYVDK